MVMYEVYRNSVLIGEFVTISENTRTIISAARKNCGITEKGTKWSGGLKELYGYGRATYSKQGNLNNRYIIKRVYPLD